MRSISYKTVNHMFAESTAAANAKKAANALLTVSTKFSMNTVTDTDDTFDAYITTSSNPYYAIRIYNGVLSSNDSTPCLIMVLYNKGTDGSWVKVVELAGASYLHMTNSTYGVQFDCTIVDTDFVLIYIDEITNSGNSITNRVTLVLCSYVDYFTSEQRNGVIYSTGGSNLFFGVCNSDKIHKSASLVTIGGTSYPSRNQSIAAPIMVTSSASYFYGYIVDPTFLYAIYVSGTQINVPLKTKMSIDGHSFVRLFSSYSVRID